MPTREEHLAAAANNAQLALDLLSNPLGVPWSPVLAFYSALHLVDAYFVSQGHQPTTHTMRRARIAREPVLDPLIEDYRTLEQLSRDARYSLRSFAPGEAEALLGGELARIRALIEALLDSAASDVPDSGEAAPP